MTDSSKWPFKVVRYAEILIVVRKITKHVATNTSQEDQSCGKGRHMHYRSVFNLFGSPKDLTEILLNFVNSTITCLESEVVRSTLYIELKE
jgi:hypothetical protein